MEKNKMITILLNVQYNSKLIDYKRIFINGTRSYGNNRNFQKDKTDTEEILRRIKILKEKKLLIMEDEDVKNKKTM